MSFDSPRLERLPSVLARTGMSRSFIYREAAAGRFPKPVKVGAASGWNTAAVDEWIKHLLDAPVARSGEL